VTNPVKLMKESPPALRATGHIEFGGEEPMAAIRRDIAHMINRHGGAVSIRWTDVDGGKPPIPRVNLPSDHPHFVDSEKETNPRKRYGLFWPEWRALEGSIVALGADPGAMIDGKIYRERADETEGAVSDFWRDMAERADVDEAAKASDFWRKIADRAALGEDHEKIISRFDEVDLTVKANVEPEEQTSGTPEVPTQEQLEAEAARDLRAAADAARELGIGEDEIARATGLEDGLEDELGEDEPTQPEDDPMLRLILDRLSRIEKRLFDSEASSKGSESDEPSPSPERDENGDPLPPTVRTEVLRPRQLAEMLREALEDARERVQEDFRAKVKKARGRIEE
jgi:hypothetical protein